MNIQFFNQWSQFLHWKEFNWITFDLIQLDFDYDKSIGVHFAATFIILGFGFTVNWIDKVMKKQCEEWSKEIKP